jgi:hypothetical protein
MIRHGQISVFYLFDVSESVALDRVRGMVPVEPSSSRVASKPAVPAYVRYQRPPLQIDGATLGVGELRGFHVRFKIFDYGVVSLLLTRAFSGSWGELTRVGHELASDNSLADDAQRLCRVLVDRIGDTMEQARSTFLSEDYFVFSVSVLEQPQPADTLLATAGADIAQLLRGELQPLSLQEREEVLRHRLSYLADDLVVPTWSAAFVLDTPAGVDAALEILEFANSQLLQFRYYDELLDAELARIYRELETTKGFQRLWPRRYTRAARRVHALFIDVNELADRTENALKLVGDVYAARLLALAHSRLGVTAWRASVHEKLKTMDEIYRFAVDQTGMERGELLELAIVAILVFELILFFMGIME